MILLYSVLCEVKGYFVYTRRLYAFYSVDFSFQGVNIVVVYFLQCSKGCAAF